MHLKTAVLACLKLSSRGRCPNGPNGAMGTWDVSRVTDMSRLFSGMSKFDEDISDWDVSRVTDMQGMFMGAESFDADITKWDVSKVQDMDGMFAGARTFKRRLCGPAWVGSRASQTKMFASSSGSITRDSCTGVCARTHVHFQCRHGTHEKYNRFNSFFTAFAPRSGQQLQRAVSTLLDNSPDGAVSLKLVFTQLNRIVIHGIL